MYMVWRRPEYNKYHCGFPGHRSILFPDHQQYTPLGKVYSGFVYDQVFHNIAPHGQTFLSIPELKIHSTIGANFKKHLNSTSNYKSNVLRSILLILEADFQSEIIWDLSTVMNT